MKTRNKITIIQEKELTKNGSCIEKITVLENGNWKYFEKSTGTSNGTMPREFINWLGSQPKVSLSNRIKNYLKALI